MQQPSLPSPADQRSAAALIVEAIDDPRAVAAEWRALEVSGVAAPFQSRDWVAAWIACAAQPAGAEVLILRGRREGETLFLLPVSVERFGPLRIARRLGGSHASYTVGVWRDAAAGLIEPDALRAALRAVGRARRIDAFELDAVPLAWDGLDHPFARALDVRPSLDDGHAFRLAASFEALLSERNAGHKRKKLRSKEKLLVAAGDYRVGPAASVAEIEATLAAFFAQKSASLTARGIADPFAALAVRDFWRRLAIASLGSPEPLLELTRLEAGGAIRAVIGATHFNGRLYALFASFAEDELSRASPGETLFFRHIEAACGRGLAVYDMGVGTERYKSSWCDETVRLVDARLAVGPAGRLYGWVASAIGVAKARLRRDPRAWALIRRWRARLGGRRPSGEAPEAD